MGKTRGYVLVNRGKMDITDSNLSYLGENEFLKWGVTFNRVSGSTIKESIFSYNTYGVFSYESSSINISNSEIYECIYECVHFGYSKGNDIFINNTVHDGFRGIEIGDNSKVIGNIVYNNTDFGIWSGWGGTNNSIIKNNTVFNSRTGIYLDGSHNNIISSNKAFDNNYNGIHLEGYSTNNKVFNNTLYNNSYYYGINLEAQSNSNLIYNNFIYDNIYNIALYDSHNNSIYNNIIFNAVHDGIYLDGKNTFNEISNNFIYNSGRNNIRILRNSYNNIFSNNVVYSAAYEEVKLWNTNGSNNFVSNTISKYNVYSNSSIIISNTLGNYSIYVSKNAENESKIEFTNISNFVIEERLKDMITIVPDNSSRLNIFIKPGTNINISVSNSTYYYDIYIS